ncbi:efflux RND transporter permease subunit, partial [Thermodesulfobacteriota bacterium]
IMIAVPFAGAAAVVALRLSGIPVALPIYVGLIILCGLVINVNIVMVHTINSLREKGESLKQAVRMGAQQRLRPIMMTVLTTVCGSLPMLLDSGAGSSVWSPFALTLACGLSSAALFSLVLTPTLYTAMAWVELRFKRAT